MPNRREEVYNVKLAELLTERGAVDAEAEQSHSHAMPDVLFEWVGLSVVLEAKYDVAGAAKKVEQQVSKRLKAGFGTLGVGLLYPVGLKTATGDVSGALDPAALRVQLASIGRQPTAWRDVSGVDGLTAVLDQARAELIDDDELDKSVDQLSASVDALARALVAQPGHAKEIVQLVTAAAETSKAKATKDQEQAAFRIAALTVITATMLQHILCDNDPAVPKAIVTSPEEQRGSLLKGWRTILDHDYAAVFEIAHNVLDTLGDSDSRLGAALVTMIEESGQIVARGVLGRHDLVGRVYHGLLTTQKYLATYYTSVPAATLLAALATAPKNWTDVKWAADAKKFGFSFADPACGTGTLLAATLGMVRRNYVSARRQANKSVSPSELGRRLIENCIYGFDILAYAVQVCASTLLLSSPGTVVAASHLYQLPFGGAPGHLGSLDMLMGGAQGTLFGAWGDSIGVDGIVQKSVPITTPSV